MAAGRRSTSRYLGTRTRSYFGIYEVSERLDDRGQAIARVLTHGTTLHGIQNLLPGLETMPTSYYARRSGVGLAMSMPPPCSARIRASPSSASAAAPCPATRGPTRPGPSSRSTRRWSRSRATASASSPRCAPQVRIVLGDARLSLSRQPADSIDILAVDAFSSDAVPMHLLTREALRSMAGRCRPTACSCSTSPTAISISSPWSPTSPRATAGMREILHYVPDEQDEMLNATISVWIALSRNPPTLERLKALSGDDSFNWQPLEPRPGFAGWSDDHASILPIINFSSMLPH